MVSFSDPAGVLVGRTRRDGDPRCGSGRGRALRGRRAQDRCKEEALSDRDEKLEALRKELLSATIHRGLVYKAILDELRKELGEERASEIFKRAIRRHGEQMAALLDPPRALADFEQWLLAMLPDDGAMHQPEVLRCDEGGLDIKFHRCPLKEGWRLLKMSQEEVADMCRHADSFDRGLFGSIFDYSMELWSEQPDDSCILHFRPRRDRAKAEE